MSVKLIIAACFHLFLNLSTTANADDFNPGLGYLRSLATMLHGPFVGANWDKFTKSPEILDRDEALANLNAFMSEIIAKSKRPTRGWVVTHYYLEVNREFQPWHKEISIRACMLLTASIFQDREYKRYAHEYDIRNVGNPNTAVSELHIDKCTIYFERWDNRVGSVELFYGMFFRWDGDFHVDYNPIDCLLFIPEGNAYVLRDSFSYYPYEGRVNLLAPDQRPRAESVAWIPDASSSREEPAPYWPLEERDPLSSDSYEKEKKGSKFWKSVRNCLMRKPK